MAKVLCILAWAGLVTAAPYYHDRRAGSSVDAEQIVNTVMKSLDLNQVIAQAMKGLSGSSFTGTFTQLPQSTLKISGSSVGENSLGRYAGVSTSGGSRFSLQSSNSGFSGSRSGSTSADKTAVVGKVLTVLNPQIEKAVAEAIRAVSSSASSSFGSSQQQSSSFGSSRQQSSFLGTSNRESSFSSGSSNFQGSSRQDESALVSQIISMLTPTITQSVKTAISSGQSSSVNQ